MRLVCSASAWQKCAKAVVVCIVSHWSIVAMCTLFNGFICSTLSSYPFLLIIICFLPFPTGTTRERQQNAISKSVCLHFKLKMVGLFSFDHIIFRLIHIGCSVWKFCLITIFRLKFINQCWQHILVFFTHFRRFKKWKWNRSIGTIPLEKYNGQYNSS